MDHLGLNITRLCCLQPLKKDYDALVLTCDSALVVWHLQEKRKVDALRQNRDYSCLFSDDADTPQATKEQPDNMPVLPMKYGTFLSFYYEYI